jgi:invasion protein IalB
MRPIFYVAAALAALGAATGSTSVAAQTNGQGGAPPQQQQEHWIVQCSAAAREGPIDCAIVQRAFITETGRLLTQFTIRVPADTRQPTISIQTPLSPFLPAGITVDVDGANGSKLEYQTCDANGCYAGSPLSDDFLQAMFRGQKLNLTIQALNKQPVKIALELTGFTTAYRKIQ